jgi:hypothetical protein
MVPSEEQTYDEVVIIAFNEFNKCHKKETTDLFLASFSSTKN